MSEQKQNKYVIAIDGPAASGKSTAAEMVAKELGFSRIDSGLLYRAITYLVIDKFGKVESSDSLKMHKFIDELEIRFDKGQIFYKSTEFEPWENITNLLRSPVIDINVSQIAKILYVREKVHKIQHCISQKEKGGVVVDGRDIGTVVFPNAFLKIFITAKASTRALRRAKQNESEKYVQILADIEERDYADIHREHGPLKKADDSIIIENDNMTLKETVNEILKIFNKKVNKK